MAVRTDVFFTRLCEENYKRVRLYCLARLGSADAADDAVQETFRRALEKADTLVAHENPVGFLYATAKNVVLEEFRRRSAAPAELNENSVAPGADPQAVLESELDRKIGEKLKTDTVIAALTEKNRRVYMCFYVRKLSVAETAKETGLSETAVRMRLVRIRRSLKAEVRRTVDMDIK